MQTMTVESHQKGQARQELLKILWRVPGLPKKICPGVCALDERLARQHLDCRGTWVTLPSKRSWGSLQLKDVQHADDALLRAVARSVDPEDMLKRAGMAQDDIESVVQLLPKAFPTGTVSPMSLWLASRKTKILLVCFVTGSIMACVGVLEIILDEWFEAKCWLAAYDGDCSDPRGLECPGICAACKFKVGMLDLKTGDKKAMYGFQPEFRQGYRDTQVKVVGKPFRCCGRVDPSDVINCCTGFFDDENDIFCDNWPHRHDSEGETCPHGTWPCSYRLGGSSYHNKLGEQVVSDVRPYIDERSWHMFYIGFGLAVLSLQLLTNFIRRVPRALLNVSWRWCLCLIARADEMKEINAAHGMGRSRSVGSDHMMQEVKVHPETMSCTSQGRKLSKSSVASMASTTTGSSCSDEHSALSHLSNHSRRGSLSESEQSEVFGHQSSQGSSRRGSLSSLDSPVVIDMLQREERATPTNLVWRLPPVQPVNAPSTSSRAWTARYEAETNSTSISARGKTPTAWDHPSSKAATIGPEVRHKQSLHSERPPSRASARVSRVVAISGG